MKLDVDWKSGLVGLALVYFTGPMALPAYGIKRWATASSWDWRDRWASVRACSVIFGLFYLVCLVFLLLLLPPFAAQEHLVAPILQHVSALVASSIVPPGFNNILVRWVFALPLAPGCALLMERTDPRSGPQHYLRVALPGEIPAPQPESTTPLPEGAAAGTSAPQQPKRHRTTGNIASRKQKKAEPKPTVVLQPQAQSSSGTATSSGKSEQFRRSLWDQTDWSTVPDDDPTKQLALAEARRQQSMHIRSVQHSLEETMAEASAAPSTAAPTAPSTTHGQSAEEQKPKKRIDWSKVDE